MKYRPDIDGLRAIAVIAVLFYHAHLGFSEGYVGVDIFFVISGFLITALLVRGVRNQTFSYPEFWERRVRRLIPALAATVFFVALTGPLILLPKHLKDLGGAIISQPLLSSNTYFWRVVRSGYFSDPPEIRPLLHTWSLGVEEQFYLFFPLLLVFLLKRQFFARHLNSTLAAVAIASFTLSIAITPSASVFSFFMLPTRAWELLIGGLLALKLADAPSAQLSPSLLKLELGALSGLGLVVFSLFFYPYSTPFPGYAAIAPCLGTALIIWANSYQRLTLVGRLLALPKVVLTGQISYSLYLWHWPLMAYSDYLFLLQTTSSKWAVLVLSYILGYASWRWIETPFRKKQLLKSRKSVFRLFKLYTLICLGLGIFCLIIAAQESKANPSVNMATNPMWHDVKLDQAKPELPIRGRTSAHNTVLLWGDSHAMSLAPVLDQLAREHNIRLVQLTHNASAPLLSWGYKDGVKLFTSDDFKRKWADLALKEVASLKPRAIFLVGFWQEYCRPSFPEELTKTIAKFHQLDIDVIFVGDNPSLLGDPWRQLSLAQRFSFIPTPTTVSKAKHEQENALVYRAIAKLPANDHLKFIDLAPEIFKWQMFVSSEGMPYYFDDDHLSEAGAMLLSPLFRPTFKELSTNIKSDQK